MTAAPLRAALGTWLGTQFDVAAQAPDAADVDLSVACMFEHEFRGAGLAGGLLRLDQALAGALTAARAAGRFRACALDSLLITRPPSSVRAKAVLVVGLGDPEAVSEDLLSRACAFAVAQAHRLQARTAAFAPNLLDAGIAVAPGLRLAHAMLDGAFSALALSDRLSKANLAAPSLLHAWSFDAGAAHFGAVVDDFTRAYAALAAGSD